MLVWEGYSRLTGRLDDTVRLILADSKSQNRKTGNMVQAFILAKETAPHERVKAGEDTLICGNCPFRAGAGCYVNVGQAPASTWRAHVKRDFATLPEIAKRVSGRMVRLGAYGDPAAVPFEVWQTLLSGAAGWTGYTHAWRYCDPRFSRVCMASVENAEDAREAHARGWRTFRVVADYAGMEGREIACLSDSRGISCEACGLCNGNPRELAHGKAAKSIAIAAHGVKVRKALASVR